jgi:hypothetical protein
MSAPRWRARCAAVAVVALGAFALPLALGTLGCAAQQLDERMAPWVGRSVSDLIAEWGAPQQTLPDGQGGQILTWFEQRFDASPNYVYIPKGACHNGIWGPCWMPLSAPYGWGGPFDYDRRVVSRSFWVDAGGTITRYAWKGL